MPLKKSKHLCLPHRQKAALIALKLSAVAAAAISVGIVVMGAERYSAIATDALPKLSSGTKVDTDLPTKILEQGQHVSMSIVGGHATLPALSQYQRVEVELFFRGSEPSAILRLQKSGRRQPMQEYSKALSKAEFAHVWQQLQTLEAAQLTDLSPYTEDLEKAASRIAIAPTPSATYQFRFKDGVYDYPNSFEVHAPEQLSDRRYQAMRDVMFVAMAQQFGDVLSQ